MTKLIWKPGTMLNHVPVVMVTCGTKESGYNIITIAWAGTVCTDPAMCSISIRPERYSYEIIKKHKEFVINLTTRELAFATDWCGVKSGREFDKFKEMNLTIEKASKVEAPLLKESPINIECVVTEIKELGTHHLFLAKIVAVNADNKYLDKDSDSFDLAKAEPICYSHGKYYALGERLGKFGFSVQKN